MSLPTALKCTHSLLCSYISHTMHSDSSNDHHHVEINQHFHMTQGI